MNFLKVSSIAPVHTGGCFRRRGALYTTAGDAVLCGGRVLHKTDGPVLFDLVGDDLVTATRCTVEHRGRRAVLGSAVRYLRAHGDFVVAGTARETVVFGPLLEEVARRPFRATASALGTALVLGTEKGTIHALDGPAKTHGEARITALLFSEILFSASLDGTVVLWRAVPVVLRPGEPVLGLDLFQEKVHVLTPKRLLRAEGTSLVDTRLSLCSATGPNFEPEIDFQAIRDGVVSTTENELYDLEERRLLIGNNDEVTDIECREGLVVCTNSGRLRVYSETVEMVQSHSGPILGYAAGVPASCSAESVVFYEGHRPRGRVRLGGSCVDGKDVLLVANRDTVHCVDFKNTGAATNCEHWGENEAGAEIRYRCFSWKAHEKEITGLAVSGTRVATSSLDRSVRVWERGTLLGTGTHRRGVNCVLFHAGLLFSADQCIKAWKVPGMVLQRTLEHSAPVLSLRGSRDLLFAGDSAGVVRVYRDGRLVFQTEGHGDRVWAIARCHPRALGGAIGPCTAEEVWITGGADGVINFYVDNTAEHLLSLREAEAERRREENTVALLEKTGELRLLVAALLEKGDRRADRYLRTLFYKDKDSVAFLRSFERQRLSETVRRLGRGAKNLELCQVLIRECKMQGLGPLVKRHRKVVEDVYLEMLSYGLYFNEFLNK